MALALEAVDAVTLFDEETPRELIAAVLPDVLVKGADWSHFIAGREEVEAAGGKVIAVPLEPGYSTTNIVDKILRPALIHPAVRDLFLDLGRASRLPGGLAAPRRRRRRLAFRPHHHRQGGLLGAAVAVSQPSSDNRSRWQQAGRGALRGGGDAFSPCWLPDDRYAPATSAGAGRSAAAEPLAARRDLRAAGHRPVAPGHPARAHHGAAGGFRAAAHRAGRFLPATGLG